MFPIFSVNSFTYQEKILPLLEESPSYHDTSARLYLKIFQDHTEKMSMLESLKGALIRCYNHHTSCHVGIMRLAGVTRYIRCRSRAQRIVEQNATLSLISNSSSIIASIFSTFITHFKTLIKYLVQNTFLVYGDP